MNEPLINRAPHELNRVTTDTSKQFGETLAMNPSTFRGAVDANHGYTPHGHGSHDMGMAFDLNIHQYVSGAEGIAGEALMAEVRDIALLDPEGRWSNVNAATLIHAMKHAASNRQDQALMDFLSMYSITQEGTKGSRDTLANHIVNGTDKTQVLDALFGDGTQTGGLVNGVIIGGTGATNPYRNIREALLKLGFEDKQPQINTAPSWQKFFNHHNHFHVFLQPPVVKNLEPANLLASTVIPNDMVVLLAQAGGAKLTPAIVRKIERNVREICNASENPNFYTVPRSDYPSGSAIPGLDVANALKKFNVAWPQKISPNQIRIVQTPLHGKLIPFRIVEKDDAGLETMIYHYTPDKGFLGDDHAVFEVEVYGYKIRVGYLFKVSKELNQDTECPGFEEAQLEDASVLVSLENAVTDDLAWDGDAQSWMRFSALATYVAKLSGTTFSFVDANGHPVDLADLTDMPEQDTTDQKNSVVLGSFDFPNATLAQTTGQSITSITFDNTAADKMDLLSVLRHEYRHVLDVENDLEAKPA